LTPADELSPPCRSLSIGVLVLNYNTWDLALRALNAAIELEKDNVKEYVLFDDGSPTPPPDHVDSRIRLILGHSNCGFSGALAAGFSAMTSDIVVLFDSDAYPLAPFSARVRKRFQEDARLGQLGFIAQDQNGRQTESFLGEPTQWSLILGQALHARLPKRPLQHSRLCVITGCMATRMEAYAQAGGFDPEFDFLDVDVDYSMRLRKSGWKVDVDDSITVFHVGGGTPQPASRRVLRFYKCRWRLLRKHRLMRHAKAARFLILARLICEQKILQLFGRFLFPDREVLKDKLLGREALVSFCRTNLL
jgi:GT2 family glycosyltransferase